MRIKFILDLVAGNRHPQRPNVSPTPEFRFARQVRRLSFLQGNREDAGSVSQFFSIRFVLHGLRRCPRRAGFEAAGAQRCVHILEPYDLEETPSASAKDGKAFVTAGRRSSRHELHLDTKADYVYAQDRSADRPLPRIPPFRTSAALVYGYGDRFGARIEGQYVAEQDRTAEFELPTDDYFLLNASVTYRVKAGPIDFDVYLKGTNLTDAEARFHTSFLKDIAPLAGRGALLGVRATF